MDEKLETVIGNLKMYYNHYNNLLHNGDYNTAIMQMKFINGIKECLEIVSDIHSNEIWKKDSEYISKVIFTKNHEIIKELIF